MKIVVDENKKNLILEKNDGTVVSTYSYKSSIKDDYTVEDMKADIKKFNETTLGQAEEFDEITKLSEFINIHNW